MNRSGLSIRFEVGGEIVKVDSPGDRRAPHRRGVWKQNEFDLLTLTKIAFPQRNFNKSHFLKRTLRY